MQNIRPVVVHSVGIIELEVTLAHVHRVGRESAAREYDGGVGRSLVGGHALVGCRGYGKIEIASAITEGVGDARHLGAHIRREVGGVEDFSCVGRRVRRVESNIDVGVRACNKNGGIRQ